MKTLLYFNMAIVAKLIDHAANATERNGTASQLYNEKFELIADPVIPPGLIWAKDEGIYLLSNGKSLPGQTPLSTGRVAYAVGFNPKTNPDYYDKQIDAVGGDDFGEFIDLDWVREAVGDRTTGFLILRLDGNRMRLGWTQKPWLK
jgi:hypothetical protein